MKLLTESDLKAIAERVEKATPGPWQNIGVCAIGGDDGDAYGYIEIQISKKKVREASHYDRDFTAHARTDIPALLAHIRMREEQLRVAMAAFKKIQKHHCTAHPSDLKQNRIETATQALQQIAELEKK